MSNAERGDHYTVVPRVTDQPQQLAIVAETGLQ
jgi:hypothetical protein